MVPLNIHKVVFLKELTYKQQCNEACKLHKNHVKSRVSKSEETRIHCDGCLNALYFHSFDKRLWNHGIYDRTEMYILCLTPGEFTQDVLPQHLVFSYHHHRIHVSLSESQLWCSNAMETKERKITQTVETSLISLIIHPNNPYVLQTRLAFEDQKVA